MAGLICASSAVADTLAPINLFEWSTQSVVGLSGLELSEDGLSFLAVSDRGWLLSGNLKRSEGRIIDMHLEQLQPILGNDGLPVAARRTGDWSDAEGLAMAPDGRLWISFERWAHVASYDGPESPGGWIRDHPSFTSFSDNRQLEALALDPDGTLYAFSEEPLDHGFPIYRLSGGKWDISGYIESNSGFAIVGADFARDGWLYLLERKLVLGIWWQNRIRRLHIGDPGSVETLWVGTRGEYKNLEGLAAWSDATGVHLTAVSDDNGTHGEAIQFVDFRWVGEE